VFIQSHRNALLTDVGGGEVRLTGQPDDAASWLITQLDGEPAYVIEGLRTEEFIAARYEEIIGRTKNLPYKMKTKPNTLRRFKKEPIEMLELLVRHAEFTRPLVHPKSLDLVNCFLANKEKLPVNDIQTQVYAGMDIFGLFHRCLTLRPLVFLTGADKYVLRDGLTRGYGLPGPPRFEDIGTTGEQEPLVLASHQSYEEAEISSLLGISVPTHFINSGSSENPGTQADGGTYEPQAIFVGLVGPRLERPGFAEYRYMVVSALQNTTENGYGKERYEEYISVPLSPKARAAKAVLPTPMFYQWASFYGKDYFPSYDEAQKDFQAGGRRFHEVIDKKSGAVSYLDLDVYKKRCELAAQMFLSEANSRAAAVSGQAVCHILSSGGGALVEQGSPDESSGRRIRRSRDRYAPATRRGAQPRGLWRGYSANITRHSQRCKPYDCGRRAHPLRH
jgi:hypothetical protein